MCYHLFTKLSLPCCTSSFKILSSTASLIDSVIHKSAEDLDVVGVEEEALSATAHANSQCFIHAEPKLTFYRLIKSEFRLGRLRHNNLTLTRYHENQTHLQNNHNESALRLN
jgi:hypothetical protein